MPLASPLPLVPRPSAVAAEPGAFRLHPSTTLSCGHPAFEDAAHWLRAAIGPATGYRLPVSSDDGADIRIVPATDLDEEAYRLTVRGEAVVVEAADRAGAFYGAQTLRQLLAPAVYRAGRVTRHEWTVPACTIQDAPRFHWRGLLIDVARHFFTKAELMRYLDLMAMHKLNVLHLHLTDDQGWRIEIERYPRLTEVGSWRARTMVGNPLRQHVTHDERPHGGYYTKDDLRELVAYAAERCITVVPEIDVPGHSQAAIAAYPELGVDPGLRLPVQTTWGVCSNVLNTEEATLSFYQHVLDEVLEIFPSPYICVGGDECRKTQWRNDPRTQELIRARGLAGEDELQSWFVRRLGAHLASRGRRLYGWEEILQGGLPEGATVASWGGMEAAVTASRLGHDVVTCPMGQTYLDFPESDRADEPSAIGAPLPLAEVYAFEPVPAGLTDTQAAHVLGAQASLWTEHIDSVRYLDYQAFPRLCAFSETVWSGPERDIADFGARLATHLRRLDALGVEYRPLDGPHPWQTRPDRHNPTTNL